MDQRQEDLQDQNEAYEQRLVLDETIACIMLGVMLFMLFMLFAVPLFKDNAWGLRDWTRRQRLFRKSSVLSLSPSEISLSTMASSRLSGEASLVTERDLEANEEPISRENESELA
ncbi:hypothetical protein QBC41DRAFT_304968 [Cercophora samala]|uniref:Uncharacterized protein n=1 Tax=Cercophora samala TaxID=330535 RepID=A0AA39Z9G5_9PEZI|nr:hypothetical protein QBC41DRAFT_304968 [Cercophora samala]